MDFFIGTMTRFGGTGIARVGLQGDRLTCEWIQEGLTDPNWLAFGPEGRLFAVGSDMLGGETGCVNEFAVVPGGLRLLSRQPTGGNEPCHIGFSRDGKTLYAVNYNSGSLAVFPLAGGRLGPRLQLIRREGRSVHPTRQTSPHLHQITRIPALPGCICATDLGTDELVVYDENAQTGKLSERYRVNVAPGEGPRHIAYGPDGTGWLVTELGNRLFSVSFFPDHGELAGGVSTLEEENTESTAAAIWLSVDGTMAYVSNRGEDSIAAFSLAPLQKTAVWRNVGETPRDFALLPGNRALVACQGEGLALLADGERIASLPLPGAVRVLPIP